MRLKLSLAGGSIGKLGATWLTGCCSFPWRDALSDIKHHYVLGKCVPLLLITRWFELMMTWCGALPSCEYNLSQLSYLCMYSNFVVLLYHTIIFNIIIINAKICLFGRLSINHLKKKFGIHKGYDLTWVIGYFSSHGDVGEVADRS